MANNKIPESKSEIIENALDNANTSTHFLCIICSKPIIDNEHNHYMQLCPYSVENGLNCESIYIHKFPCCINDNDNQEIKQVTVQFEEFYLETSKCPSCKNDIDLYNVTYYKMNNNSNSDHSFLDWMFKTCLCDTNDYTKITTNNVENYTFIIKKKITK